MNTGLFFRVDVNSKKWLRIEVDGEGEYSSSLHTANLYEDKIYMYGVTARGTATAAFKLLDSLVVFDPVLCEMVLLETFGGVFKPPKRSQHTANVCEKLRLLTVFGGTPLRQEQLWILNLSTLQWMNPKSKGLAPSPRAKHASCIVDSMLYIYSGGSVANASADLFRIDLNQRSGLTWHKIDVQANCWFGTRGPSMSYVGSGRLIVFGGFDNHKNTSNLFVIDDVLLSNKPQCRRAQRRLQRVPQSLDPAQITYFGNPPEPRESSRMVFAHDKMYIFGGNFSDGWSYFELMC